MLGKEEGKWEGPNGKEATGEINGKQEVDGVGMYNPFDSDGMWTVLWLHIFDACSFLDDSGLQQQPQFEEQNSSMCVHKINSVRVFPDRYSMYSRT